MIDLSQRLANLSPAKRRLLEERLRKKPQVAEPIAIVGMACRFPGARDLDSYWQVIRDGIDATGEIPSTRWDVDALYDPTGEESGKMSVRWAGLVDDVEQFDPRFFGISPREAARMDPQQRLLLEVAWETLENAVLAPERMSGTATGVFIGIGGTDYSKIPCQYENYYQHIDAHVGTGNALSIAANRLSYILDFRGPSMAVDTACSSGMVGVHLAVQSLRNRECDAALAGGVNLILSPETTIAFSKARMLSPDGCCRPFDEGANGYVRGEGCGIVMLKRLTDATRDGDNVLAVLRASATNQDGRTSGITAPNGLSQQAVIRAAWKQAGLSADRVSYIEAHGTGTPLGDPIEVEALGHLFPSNGANSLPCHVSSVKANIGHTETVSGIAGIIKTVLMMQHGLIPPQLHLGQLNPRISLEKTRLRIPTQPVDWQTGGLPRIAGVSSFGFGGTNTHVILEEASPRQPSTSENDRPLHVMTLSAKTESAVGKMAARFAEYLAENPNELLADICHSENTGRSHFNHRAAITVATRDELQEKLSTLAQGKKPRGIKSSQVRLAQSPKVAFLFTGQGSQYIGMGRALYKSQPAFRNTLDECDEILREHLELPLLSVLYPNDGEDSPLDETVYTQPALFSLEYSLATLWRSWGIEPSIVLGHSVGEYVAACIASVFSLQDGLTLIAHRARLMQQLPQDGQMAVVFAPHSRAVDAIASYQDRVSIAAANGPDNTVISGHAETVNSLVEKFESDGVKTQRLTVSHAFHSPLMEPMLDEFEQLAAQVKYERPRIPLVSNLTGLITSDASNANYWRQHIRNTVRFADGMQQLAAAEPDVMLEIGPATSLLGMGRRCLPKSDAKWLPSLRKGQDDWATVLGSLTDLYVLGAKVDWQGFDRDWSRRRLRLPTYPFERSRYWFDHESGEARPFSAGHGPRLHPLLGSLVPSALETALFQAKLSSRSPNYLVDHQVQGSPVVPAAAYVEQALATAEQSFGEGRHGLENVAIQQAMFLPEGASRVVQVAVAPETGGECQFETYSTAMDTPDGKPKWLMHACGKLRHADTWKSDDALPTIDLDEVRGRVIDVKTREEFYDLIRTRRLEYGPAFQVLRDLRRSEFDGVAEVRLPNQVAKELDQYHLHPALGDAFFQSVAGIVPLEPNGEYSPFTYMPTGVRRVRIYDDLVERMYTYAIRTSSDDRPSPESVEADVFLCDETGRVLVEFSGVQVQRVGRSSLGEREVDVQDWLYRVDWVSQPLDESGVRGQESEVSDSSATWLIFVDDQGVGEELANRLHQRGDRSVVVKRGEQFAAVAGQNGDADVYHIDPLDADHFKCLLEESLGTENPKCAGVVHLWSIDLKSPDGSHEIEFDDLRRLSCGSALRLIQQLARVPFSKTPSLWLITQGGQSVSDEHDGVNPAQSAIWGMGRVAAVEHPELGCRLVDFASGDGLADTVTALQRELSTDTSEGQIAYRNGGERFVARLARARDALANDSDAGCGLNIPADSAFRLHLGSSGSFDSLRFDAFARRQPDKGQVEIEVRATGLNFSDVLKAMGLYPGITDDIVPLGIECSGVVTAVGEGIDRFKAGDEVMGVVPCSFASHALTAEYALVHKPNTIDHDEAATIPITFLTAYYGLVRLAHLQPGERVLIHAGAGGVGLAAIQIAQHIGAEIFATAGSDEKRDYLRSLGVRHVMNSRSLDFADQIMEITGREGVDVVLNSLPGDAITKSLSILKAYGRFLEIGKIDIYQNRMIGLLPFQDNLSYFAIDLDRMLRQRPDYIRAMFAELMEHIESGTYQPLVRSSFPIDDTIGAFRHMAQRKNIGKVVVSLNREPTETSVDDGKDDSPADLVRDDGTYLVTGGLGALGLQVANWFAVQGAKHIVLISRRPPHEAASKSVDSLRSSGVQVATVQGDVADRESLDGAIAQIPNEFPPLRGVVHAAGVLADGVLFDMDLAQLDQAMAPKVQGAWNLHRATLDSPLDFFALFSSVACVLGSPGQGNYAAGNAFLDGLAAYRRSQGRPATSINWGPWAGTGMAAEAGRDEQIKARGLELIPAAHGLDVLGRLLSAEVINVAVMDTHWSDLLRMMTGRMPSLLTDIAESEGDQSDGTDDAVDHEFRAELLSAELKKRSELLRDYFADELARIMGIETSDLDVQQPLAELGMDSLLAMELKNNLERQLAFTLPMASFLEGPTVTSLAGHAAKALGGEGETDDSASSDIVAYSSPRSWSPLVALQPKGDKRPLFCIHPLGGDVRCYSDLARSIGEDQPFYALRGRGSEGLFEPHGIMDEMVDAYLDAIRKVQPRGPYRLAGWSAGGIFAYEMTRRLKEQNEVIALLACFDTPLPSIYDHVDLADNARFVYDFMVFVNRFSGSQMEVSYEQLCDLDEEGQFQVGLREAKSKKVVPEDVSEQHIRRLVDAGRAHTRFIMDYDLMPLEQPMHLFRPEQADTLAEMSGQTLTNDLGWSNVLGDRLILHEASGEHFSMMTGENAAQLAKSLTDCLEKAETEDCGSCD